MSKPKIPANMINAKVSYHIRNMSVTYRLFKKNRKMARKSVSSTHSVGQMKNSQMKNKCDVLLQLPRFTIYSLMVFPFEKFLTDKTYLGKHLYLFIITYLNKTKTFSLITSKNLPWELYATTAPGF